MFSNVWFYTEAVIKVLSRANEFVWCSLAYEIAKIANDSTSSLEEELAVRWLEHCRWPNQRLFSGVPLRSASAPTDDKSHSDQLALMSSQHRQHIVWLTTPVTTFVLGSSIKVRFVLDITVFRQYIYVPTWFYFKQNYCARVKTFEIFGLIVSGILNVALVRDK